MYRRRFYFSEAINSANYIVIWFDQQSDFPLLNFCAFVLVCHA